MKKLFWILVIVLLSVAVSVAQERGNWGLNFRVNSSQSLGITYHVSDVIAFRPAILFEVTSKQKSEVRTAFNRGANHHVNIGGELTTLLYLSPKEKSSPYMGISASYTSLGSQEKNFVVESDLVIPALAEVKAYKIAGLFGLQHSFSRRFNIFGEISFGWHKEVLTSKRLGKRSNMALSLSNAGLGILFYLH